MNPFIIDSLCPPKQGQNDQEKKGFAGGSEVRSRPQNRITATKKATSLSADGFGPSGESRTHGLLNPIQARYQTALHPVETGLSRFSLFIIFPFAKNVNTFFAFF